MPRLLYNYRMTMTPKPQQIERVARRLLNIREMTPLARLVTPSDAEAETLFAAAFDLAHSLDVPRDRVANLLIHAHDSATLTDFPYADHLVYLYMLTVHTLYFISDDTFDELLEHFAPAA